MIDLGVWEFNKEAAAFYESCGMKRRICRMEYRLEEKADEKQREKQGEKQDDYA